jgi:hypothetical protein
MAQKSKTQPRQMRCFKHESGIFSPNGNANRLVDLFDGMCRVLDDEKRMVVINGQPILTCPTWMRDHILTLKGSKYLYTNLKPTLQFFLDNQSEQGFFLEMYIEYTDSHKTFVDKECMKEDAKNCYAYVRLELEADIEYLMTEGVYTLWQSTGDDDFVLKALPKLEKGIIYNLTDEKRFAKDYGLIKRTFTIDTWDFTYGSHPTQRRILDGMPMSIMHGDNSGVYHACLQIAEICDYFGFSEKAVFWRFNAEEIKKAMFKYLWNGKFFIHQLHLNHNGIDDETNRLSLSNPYDINRGVCSYEQARSIIKEYIDRGIAKKNIYYAPWFSIDPPYDNGFGELQQLKPFMYMNGGLPPFVAGELARAAFDYGYEKFGWETIQKIIPLYERDKRMFFLYDHDASGMAPGPGPECWGAAAIMSAIVEGLAGIKDIGIGYNKLEITPRLAVTGIDEIEFLVQYPESKKTVNLKYWEDEQSIEINLLSPAQNVLFKVLLPEGKTVKAVKTDKIAVKYGLVKVENSDYVTFSLENTGEFSENNIEIFF